MRLPDLPSKATIASLCGVFFFLGLLAYGASLGNGFVHWDDGLLIYQNPAVMEVSASSIWRAFSTYDPELYIPLTLLTYQADYLFGGGSATLFHVQNLFWHIANALLVCWFAFLMLKNKGVAVFLGLLFLLHPVHTEAVAWASGRKDVLSTFFFFAALISWLYARDRDSRRLFLLSAILFALGLMAKVMVITLPIIMMLLLFRERRKPSRQDALSLMPYFVLSVIFGIVALFGKTEAGAITTLSQKILMAFKSAMFYPWQLLWPTHLSVLYPYNGVITLASPDFFVPGILLAAVIVLVLVLLKWSREPLTWVLFYLVTLAPTFINFAKGDHDFYVASDRYTYIPSVGLFVLFGLGVTWFVQQDSSAKIERLRMRILAGIAAIFLTVFALRTYQQSLLWRDSVTLFTTVIERFPDASYVAHANVANAYRLQKEFDEAIDHYQQSLSIRPHPRTYSNLGDTYRQMGMYDKAADAYRSALALEEDNVFAHFGLGILFAEQGRYDQALEEYHTALELDPDSGHVLSNMGALYMKRGQITEAEDAYRRAIEADPYAPTPYYNLAVLKTREGEEEVAIELYESAVRLQPKSLPARLNLGLLYAKHARIDDAIRQFREMLLLDPNNRAAHSALQQLGAD